MSQKLNEFVITSKLGKWGLGVLIAGRCRNWSVLRGLQVLKEVWQLDLRVEEGKFLGLSPFEPILISFQQVKMMKLSEKEKENALNEVRILASVNHANIAGYKEAFFEESTQCLCIVMEFCDNGDL